MHFHLPVRWVLINLKQKANIQITVDSIPSLRHVRLVEFLLGIRTNAFCFLSVFSFGSLEMLNAGNKLYNTVCGTEKLDSNGNLKNYNTLYKYFKNNGQEKFPESY